MLTSQLGILFFIYIFSRLICPLAVMQRTEALHVTGMSLINVIVTFAAPVSTVALKLGVMLKYMDDVQRDLADMLGS